MADTTISATTPGAGVDPDDLATCLRVIAELDDLPADHPDVVTVRRATGRLYKTVRKNR
jgi:hypothetical protein